MKYKLLFFLIILLILISCTEEVNLEIPVAETQPVVNSIVTPDSLFYVKISKNNGGKPLNNANVKLYWNNTFIQNLQQLGNGIYKTYDYYPKSGNKYRIEINASQYQKLIAREIIPEPVSVLNISHKDSSFIDEYNGYYGKLDLTFKDPSDHINYYEIEIKELIDTSSIVPIDTSDWRLPFHWKDSLSYKDWLLRIKQRYIHYNKNSNVIYCFDPVVNEELNNDNYFGWFLNFSDNMINGKKYTLSINIDDYYTNNIRETKVIVKKRKFIVYFRSISKNYYLYKKKMSLAQEANSSDIWNTSNNFVRMYSNVEGGHGIFAGYSTYVDSIIVED